MRPFRARRWTAAGRVPRTDGAVRIIRHRSAHRIGARRGCGVCEQVLTARTVRRRRPGGPAPVPCGAGNVTGAQERSSAWSTVGAMYDASPARDSSVEDFWAVIPAGGAGHPAVAAVPRRGAQVPARPDRHRPLAAAGDLGPARAAARRTGSWSSPGAAPGRRPRAAAGPRAGRTVLAEPVAAGLHGGDRPGRRRPGAPRPRRGDRARSPPTTSSATPRPSAACVREAVAVARTGLRRHDRHRADPPRDRLRLHPRRRRRWRSTARRHALAVSEFVEKPDAATAGA